MPGRDQQGHLRSISITQLEPTISSTRLYLGGDFKDETKGVLITAGTVTDGAALASTRQEADTRIILHSILR